jgi:hypothetical protein
MKKLNIPDTAIIAVPAEYSPVDRTWASALALKIWIDSAGYTGTRFDLCSHSTHTRRSMLLFKKALKKPRRVGAIAVRDRDYSPGYWWKTSKGVRNVINELVAYLYALVFIWIS